MRERYLHINLTCSIRTKKFLPLVMLIFTSALLQQNAYSADVVLAWNPNNEEDLAGYVIYYGTASRVYDQEIDVGDVTTYTITELDEDVFYYFSATAYDLNGNESDYSNEVTYFISQNSTALDNVQDDASNSNSLNVSSDVGGCFILSLFSYKRVIKR